mgnify:CR=1 FL=1
MFGGGFFPSWEGGLLKPSFDKYRLVKTDLIIISTVIGVPLISKHLINKILSTQKGYVEVSEKIPQLRKKKQSHINFLKYYF